MVRKQTPRKRQICAVDGRLVELIEGSIASLGEHFDALVSSDDSELTHSGGASEALWAAAGSQLTEETEYVPADLTVGDVHLTSAGQLDAEYLLHAITLDLAREAWLDGPGVRALLDRILSEAEELDCRSIALPLVGTGGAGLKTGRVVTALARSLARWLRRASSIERIAIACLPEEAASVTKSLRAALHARGFRAGKASASDGLQLPFARLLDAPSLLDVFQQALAAHVHALKASVEPSEVFKQLVASGTQHPPAGPLTNLLRTTPGQLVHELTDLRARAGRPLTRRELTLLARAVQERNRIAHRLTSDEELEDGTVTAEAMELLLPELLERGGAFRLASFMKPSIGALSSHWIAPEGSPAPGPWEASWGDDSEADESRGTLACLAEEVPSAPRPRFLGSSPDEPVWSNAPVVALQRFLQDTLEPADHDSLMEDLEARGYRGPDDQKLLEYCVRHEKPQRLLMDQLSRSALKAAVKSRLGADADTALDSEELAWLLLEDMGFGRALQPHGLSGLLEDVRKAPHELALASRGAITACVLRLARRLEYTILVLLEFLCRAAFREFAASYLRNTGRLEADRRLRTCSLGTLTTLLEAVANDLESSDEDGARRLLEDLGGQRIHPPGASNLATIRNAFSHYNENKESASDDQLRTDALEFVEQLRQLVEHLGSPETRVFPSVVTVEELRVDRFGRRVVHLLTDDGREEQVFTDETLIPGELYFMRAQSNPLAVHPILVPAGSLRWSSRELE